VTIDELGSQAVGFVLVLARVGGLFVLAPVFSARMLPMRARFIAACGLSLALTPLATAGRTLPEDAGATIVLLLKEAVIGFGFAFGLAAISAAITAGAGVIDVLSGFSLATLVDPMSGAQTAVVGQLYAAFTAVTLVVTGGDHMMIQGLASTYELAPIDRIPSPEFSAMLALEVFGRVLVLGLQIVAPALIALLLVDAALGMIARSVPQMNVFFVGVPAKILVGIAVVSASLPFFSTRLGEELERSVEQTLRVLAIG
jgi:flagellar biosynthetic protein FliR